MTHQFIHFVTRHWPMVLAFIVVLILIFIEEVRSGSSGGKRMTPQQVTHCMNRESGLVIDIRDANAFRDGHIVGSKNIVVADIEKQIGRLGDKEKDIIIVAGSQQQKAQAVAGKLSKAGFSKVHQLAGGISAWKKENLPLVKGSK